MFTYSLYIQHKVEGLLNNALEHDSSSLSAGFPLPGPLGETAVVVIVGPVLQTKVVGDRFLKTDSSYTTIPLQTKLSRGRFN